MGPARIPSSLQLCLGWAVGAVMAVSGAGCSSASDPNPKGIIPGAALGKLCHELNRSGQPITLTLQIGDPAMKTVNITARTGVCAPPRGMPCVEIPVGRVPLKLMEGDRLLAEREVILTGAPDGGPLNEYVFQPVINNALQVVISGGRIRPPENCQDLDFPPPDGGVRDAGDGAVGEAGVVEAGVAEAGAPDGGAPEVGGAGDAGVDAAGPADVAVDAAEPADVAAVDVPVD